MKKVLILLVLSFCIPCASWAKSSPEKEYEKLIKKYDIDSLAKTANTIEEFWEYSRNRNERFAKFFIDSQKKKKATVKANQELSLAFSQARPYIKNLPYVTSGSTDTLQAYLLDDLGVLSLFPATSIYIVDEDEEFNAFSLPDGRIFIETGILLEDEMTYYGLLGICAHEFAHFLFQHVLVNNYETIKAQKKNAIIAGVVAAVETGASIYGMMNGVRDDNLGESIITQLESPNIEAEKFRFKYSREQEIEADIVAFRFLDFIGVGGEYYIKTLELLDKLTIEYYGETDHPSTKFRIGLLEYMREHPQIEVHKPKVVIY